MNIINRIASRGLKANKLKNGFVIFTILLATCMMMSVGLYFLGDIERKNNEISNRYQASFLNVTEDEVQSLASNPDVEKVGITKEIGQIDGEEYRLSFIYMDKVQLELSGYESLDGRMPEGKNEIVILKEFADYFDQNIDIGDSITLGDGEEEKDFTISGILPVKSDGKNYMVIVSYDYLKDILKDDLTFSAYIKLRDSKDLSSEEIREKINEIGKSINCETKDIVFSSYYFALKDMDTNTQFGVIVGVYIVTTIACALVVYSIFYISVITKLNEYGRLRTIGANKKQIRRIIKKEANRLSIIGIPVGIIISAILSYCIMPEVFSVRRVLLLALVVSIVIFIMIRIATAKPGKMAAKVSPIMAVRDIGFSGDESKKRTRKMHRRLTPFSLAYINVMRNKKKAVLSICSLGLCGVLLMASASYLQSIDPVEMAKASDFPYGEIKIRFVNGIDSYSTAEIEQLQEKELFNKNFCNALTSIEGVEGIKTYIGGVADFNYKNKITEASAVDIISKQDFKQMYPYLDKGKITYEQLSTENGLIVADRDWEMVYGFSLDIGDTITITNHSGDQQEYRVMGVVSADYSSGGNDVFFASENKKDYFGNQTSNLIYQIEVKVNTQKENYVEEEIARLIEDMPELEITTLSQSAASYRASLNNQILPIFMLVFFIAIFGIVNMINTLLTNVITRKKELSTLQAIGLSNKQLQQMLVYEGIIYFIGISIMTLSFGSISGAILCSSMNKISAFGSVGYSFPLSQTLIYLALILGVIILCSIISILYYKRETLVERMRSMT